MIKELAQGEGRGRGRHEGGREREGRDGDVCGRGEEDPQKGSDHVFKIGILDDEE